MKAVVYRGPHQVAVEDVPDPKIERPTDAIVKITSTNICGSDLHMYEGRTDFEQAASSATRTSAWSRKEGIIEDLRHGHLPNVLGEMGIRSELRYNPAGLVRKALVTTAVVGGIMVLRNRRKRY